MVTNIMSDQILWTLLQYYGNYELCDANCSGIFSDKSLAIAAAVSLVMKGYEDIDGLDKEFENLFTNDLDEYYITWQQIDEYLSHLGICHIPDYVNYKIEKKILIVNKK